MRSHLLAIALAILAHAGVWALAGALWTRLPERFPVHYDIEGRPDRWGDREALSWFGLPLVGLGITTLLLGLGAGIPWMAGRWPGIMNVPRKEAFVRLPPDARRKAVRPAQAMLAVLALLANGLFAYLIWGAHAIATGARPTLSGWVMAPFFAGVILSLVFGTLALRRAILAERR